MNNIDLKFKNAIADWIKMTTCFNYIDSINRIKVDFKEIKNKKTPKLPKHL